MVNNSEEIKKSRRNKVDSLVSSRLYALRLQYGKTQKDVAEALSVSSQQIYKYEEGSNHISSGRLYDVAKYFGVHIDYFFKEDDSFNNTLNHVLAEEQREYSSDSTSTSNITEKEVIALVKAFSEIKDTQIRKKMIENKKKDDRACEVTKSIV